MDPSRLTALAKAANQAEWPKRIAGIEGDTYIAATGPWYRERDNMKDDRAERDAAFLAACSPDVILALIERVRELAALTKATLPTTVYTEEILTLQARVRELEVMNHSDRQYLMEKESKLAVRVRVLEEALRKYGCHKWASLNCEAPHEPCICGLAAALTPSEPRDG